MKRLAIIPARGGSKRIPGKNIKLFDGKPIIQYSIDIAKQSGLFDEIMVSTDDLEIAELSKNLGASVPFFRSAENSGDKCGLAEVIVEVINSYEKLEERFNYYCCIFATAPFITVDRLHEAYNVMIDNNFDSVLPLIPYPVPIQQAFKINQESNKVEMFFDDQYGIMTQDFIKSYYDAGQFYWMRPESVKKRKRITCENSGAIFLSELEAHDIDTIDDWKIAEQKFHYIKELKSKGI